MSASYLFSQGSRTIDQVYLPSAPAPHPYVENPMASDLYGGGYEITGLRNITIQGTPANPTGALTVANVSSASYTLYCPNDTDGGLQPNHLQLYAYNNTVDPPANKVVLDIDANSSPTEITATWGTGGGCILQINGVSGVSQVNDPKYNPALKLIEIASYAGAASTMQYSLTSSFGAGTYQMQLYGENIANITAGSALITYAVDPAVGTRVLPYSSASVSATEVNIPGTPANAFCLNSGYFNHAGGNLTLWFQQTGAGTGTGSLWTATEWGLRLVKL